MTRGMLVMSINRHLNTLSTLRAYPREQIGLEHWYPHYTISHSSFTDPIKNHSLSPPYSKNLKPGFVFFELDTGSTDLCPGLQP